MTNDPYVNWFRQTSPYINAHRGKTFVIMLSGETAAQPNFNHIVHDIALLNSLGVRLVLVQGARPQIDQQLTQLAIEPKFHHNLRVSDAETLKATIAASSSVRTEIEARLSMGLSNTPMQGAKIRVASGNFITAKPLGVYEGVDLGHTGEVRRIDIDGINHHLSHQHIVLVSHLGYSPSGEIFNLSGEEVASQVAIKLKADKLIVFGADDGVTDSHNRLRSELLTDTAERLVKNYLANIEDRSAPHTELARNLETSVRACRGGVNRCHLISYENDGALLTELFTRDGSGTMVLHESYEQVRQATFDDVGGLLEMIQPMEEQGILVRRSRERLEEEIERFTLIERDGAIIACAALYPYLEGERKMAELACVAVSPEYRGGARGDQLLRAIEAHAKSLGVEAIFVLTTRTAHWFTERGFAPAPVDALPDQKKSLYNLQRNSKVFVKSL